MPVHKFFTDQEKKSISEAIKKAELNTSGEIRVHVESRCRSEAVDCAAYWFERLHMHKTALRNGVLFYMAVDDHKFAILGDAGINSVTPPNFWEEISNHMTEKFRAGMVAEGLAEGIMMAGEQLKTHFPRAENDVNELPDEISFGKRL